MGEYKHGHYAKDTDAVPVTVGVCCEAAVIVAEPAVAGAVNRPVESIVPSEADHSTVWFVVPATLALNCCVAPTAIVAVAGDTETEVAAGGGGLRFPACVVRSATTGFRDADAAFSVATIPSIAEGDTPPAES